MNSGTSLTAANSRDVGGPLQIPSLAPRTPAPSSSGGPSGCCGASNGCCGASNSCGADKSAVDKPLRSASRSPCCSGSSRGPNTHEESGNSSSRGAPSTSDPLQMCEAGESTAVVARKQPPCCCGGGGGGGGNGGKGACASNSLAPRPCTTSSKSGGACCSSSSSSSSSSKGTQTERASCSNGICGGGGSGDATKSESSNNCEVAVVALATGSPCKATRQQSNCNGGSCGNGGGSGGGGGGGSCGVNGGGGSCGVNGGGGCCSDKKCKSESSNTCEVAVAATAAGSPCIASRQKSNSNGGGCGMNGGGGGRSCGINGGGGCCSDKKCGGGGGAAKIESSSNCEVAVVALAAGSPCRASGQKSNSNGGKGGNGGGGGSCGINGGGGSCGVNGGSGCCSDKKCKSESSNTCEVAAAATAAGSLCRSSWQKSNSSLCGNGGGGGGCCGEEKCRASMQKSSSSVSGNGNGGGCGISNGNGGGSCCSDEKCGGGGSAGAAAGNSNGCSGGGCGGGGAGARARVKRWTRVGYGLAFFSIAWNVLEGGVSVVFSVESESVALGAFGMDSFIEVISACVVLWRLPGELFVGSQASESAEATVKRINKERKATRAIGFLLLALAFITTGETIMRLIYRGSPSTTVPGIVISCISLSFMGLLYWGKRRVACELSSRTLAADARCSLGCIQLSLVVLLGSLLFLLVPGAWWVDSAASLVIALLIGRDGYGAFLASFRADFEGGCPCCHN